MPRPLLPKKDPTKSSLWLASDTPGVAVDAARNRQDFQFNIVLKNCYFNPRAAKAIARLKI